MLDFFLSIIPSILALVSCVIHFFVFHRLKCTKGMVDCLKDDFLPYLKGQDIQTSDLPPEDTSKESAEPEDKGMNPNEVYLLEMFEGFLNYLRKNGDQNGNSN